MANTTLYPLHRADGSATYAKNGYSVIAAINGPIEVQRRDELPEEAAVDVTVRPCVGVGGKYRLIFSSKKLRAKFTCRVTRKASRIYYSEHSPPYHTSISTPA